MLRKHLVLRECSVNVTVTISKRHTGSICPPLDRQWGVMVRVLRADGVVDTAVVLQELTDSSPHIMHTYQDTN